MKIIEAYHSSTNISISLLIQERKISLTWFIYQQINRSLQKKKQQRQIFLFCLLCFTEN